MPDAGPGRLIGELTFLEISKFLSERSILCLPIGSIEQHGPHLPLNTDVVLAEGFTRRIISRWGEAYRHRWKLPKIKSFAPAGNDEASKTLSQYDIGVEWQMGAMLLNRADRQTKYRSLAEKL